MARRVSVVIALVLAGAGLWAVPSAHAQERVPLDLAGAFANTVVPPLVLTVDDQAAPAQLPYRRSGRGSLMTSLYVSTAAMQALDVHSTLQALDRGAVEANPLVGGLSGRKAAFIALKAGVAFSTIMAARNMSKRNKVAAVATLVAINSAYAMVVRHNYRVARQLR
jgi:hypothetical protein